MGRNHSFAGWHGMCAGLLLLLLVRKEKGQFVTWRGAKSRNNWTILFTVCNELEAESLVVGLERVTVGACGPWLLISTRADLLRLVMPTELVQRPCLTASLSAAPRFDLLQLCQGIQCYTSA
jgi:hypothetical protein